jgi:hypothetical protein
MPDLGALRFYRDDPRSVFAELAIGLGPFACALDDEPPHPATKHDSAST